MTNLIVEVSKYLMAILFACYTYECFSVLRGRLKEEQKNGIFRRQRIFMYLMHLDAYLVVYAVTDDPMLVAFYIFQVIFVAVTMSCYHLLYQGASKLLVNNMCMLLIIGFIMLTRLSFDKAFRQCLIALAATCYHLLYQGASKLLVNNMCMLLIIGFIMLTRLSFDKAFRQCLIALAATVLTLIVPFFIHKLHFLRKMTWLYAVAGIGALAAVAAFGATSYGAKLSLLIAGVSVQPSEFVKIIFVFFVACMLYEQTDFRRVLIATVVAAVHVLLLVASRDLGGALIFFVTYCKNYFCIFCRLYAI